MALSFKVGKDEYSVRELYANFKDKIPLLAMVTEGYSGDAFFDEFTRGQALRIHKYTKQKRIIAEVLQGVPCVQGCKLSIPVDYKMSFCISKGKHKGYPLQKILQEHSLPIKVRFLDDPTCSMVSIDGVKWRARDFTLKLVRTYDDIYLVGNPITENDIYDKFLAIPINTLKLKMAVIENIEGCEIKWSEYIKAMSETVNRYIKYETQTADQNIFVYDDEDTVHSQHEKQGMRKGRQSHVYDVIDKQYYDDPNVYSVISDQFLKIQDEDKKQEKSNKTGENPYHSFPNAKHTMPGDCPSVHMQEKKSGENNSKRLESGTIVSQQKPSTPNIATSKTNRNLIPPPVPPRPSVNVAKAVLREITSSKTSESKTCPMNSNQMRAFSSDKGDTSSPNTADMIRNTDQLKTTDKSTATVLTNSRTHLSEPTFCSSHLNIDTREEANSIGVGSGVLEISSDSGVTSLESSDNNNKKEITNTDSAENESSDNLIPDVTSMSTSEVCNWLRRLRLEKYTTTFKDNLIDGCILADLDDQILINELGMKKFETIKLRKFITKGYIPQA